MIEKYIAELLETNNRVIVPDFGAFMVKIDAGDKTVTFNDFLKYNDGLLVNHIASKEKISKDDAFKKIREFVKELLNTLKTSQKFTLGTMGSLVKDERGGIRFVAEKSTNTVSPEDAVESEKVEATTDETAPKATGKTVVDVKKDEKAPIKPGAPLGQKPAATPPPPIPGQRPEQLGKPTVKPGTPPPPQGRNPNIAPKKAPKKNNTTTILIIVGIVVVLGVIGGLISLNYDEWFGKAERERLAEEAHQKELVMKAQQDSIREVERVQDSIRIATAEAEELARQKEIEKNQKKYYLVAGSFKVQKNAQRFSEQLNSQGYKSEVFMESRGFWRVSYNSFIDRREAFNEYQKLKQNEIQVWVIRH